MLRRSIVAVVGVVIVVGAPTAAVAHFYMEYRNVYINGSRVIEGRAEISHGNGGGAAKSTVTTTNSGTVYQNMTAGNLRAKNILWYRSNGQNPAICVNGSWNYNSKTDYELSKSSSYDRPCGAYKEYANQGGAFANFGEGWVGGWTISGYHQPFI